MKKLNNKTKILILLIVIIIVVGIAITLTKGLNFDLRYEDTKKVELYLQKEFEISDIKQITNEVMPDQPVLIQKVEVFEDSVSIIAKDITDEQKANLIDKVNEKYETEFSSDTIEIESIPHTRGRDIIKPYILPFVIATIIILVYMAIRYYKLGILKTIAETIGILILAQALLLSIMAITRIPVGRVTIPLVIAIYILTLLGITSYFEKKNLDNSKNQTK